MIGLNESYTTIILLFSVIILGYLLGRIRVKGVSFGTVGCFLLGLLFGHFGISFPPVLQAFGMALIMATIGLSSGADCIYNLKKNGTRFVLSILLIIACGILVAMGISKLLGMDAALVAGIFSGAFTSSPGFAAAKEGLSAERSIIVAAGYGLAYPIAMVLKVIIAQLIPIVTKADIPGECALIKTDESQNIRSFLAPFRVDKFNYFALALTIVAGLAIGALQIRLPGGGTFGLGTAGGMLIAGLVVSALGHIGKLDLRMRPTSVAALKELGLCVFYACAGAEGGQGIAAVFSEYGVLPILIAILLTAVPFVFGYFVTKHIFRIPMLHAIGCVSSATSCMPAAEMLEQFTGSEDIMISFAAPFPFAMIFTVLGAKIFMMLMG